MLKKGYEIIKEERLKKNISQRELARRIGVDNATLLKIESGKTKKPKINIIFKICKVLKLDYETEFKIYDFYKYDLDELLEIGIISEYTTRKELEKINSYTIRINENMKVFDILKLFEDYRKNKINLEALFNYILLITGIDLNQYIYKNDKKNRN